MKHELTFWYNIGSSDYNRKDCDDDCEDIEDDDVALPGINKSNVVKLNDIQWTNFVTIKFVNVPVQEEKIQQQKNFYEYYGIEEK
ncbi:hypothetical protein [Mycoplasmoides alvi]|uniref:hypothetical protein n=1 Tax=Mycoplasmoides alvi TaxID=78580 RepID=UPI00051B8ACC|nr:hypothetical protein [Mycoplasmoides alvi]